MDPLSDILTQLRFSGLLYFAIEFTAPWGIRVPPHPGAIHLVQFTDRMCSWYVSF